jgi:DNA-binding transcriptional LysR family regulator
MDLRQLRHFVAIAEELSFSKAATRLRIAQPALSRTIKEMEDHLGTVLLDRNRKRVRLTNPGATLLREARALLEQHQSALESVRRAAQGEEGELRIGYIGPPTRHFLGRILAEYRHRHPKVAVHLEERTPERVWEMVASRRLNLGFTRPVPLSRDLGLHTLTLREEPLGVVTPPKHPFAQENNVPWAALEREKLVVLARREGVGIHDAVLAGCRNAGFAPILTRTPSLISTVFTYVEAGVGLGVVTEGVVPPNAPLAFTRLTPAITIPLVLAWQEEALSPATLSYKNLVQTWLKSGDLDPAPPLPSDT